MIDHYFIHNYNISVAQIPSQISLINFNQHILDFEYVKNHVYLTPTKHTRWNPNIINESSVKFTPLDAIKHEAENQPISIIKYPQNFKPTTNIIPFCEYSTIQQHAYCNDGWFVGCML